MSLIRKFFLFFFAMAAISSHAAYVVHNVEGQVVVAKKTGNEAVAKGTELAPNETLELSPASRIEIFNSNTKEVYTAEGPAKMTVIDVMMGARKSSSSSLGSMAKYVRFGNQDRSNTRRYTEGSVKRAMQIYDPEGGSMSVDPDQLARNILANLAKGGTTPDCPVTVTHAPMGETGREFRVQNTLDFPVYLNVIEVDKDGNVELSELGQPTGCFVLLPGQAIAREHADGLNPDSRHIVVITHCQFDIDDLLASIKDAKASNQKANPDPSLPVYQVVL